MILKSLWRLFFPKKIRCPHCWGKFVAPEVGNFDGGVLWYCKKCHGTFIIINKKRK